MPRNPWSNKRERQYEHIKEGLLERGESNDTAEEIAARTVNKERAQHGEAKEPSAASLKDMPASVRGGHRSHEGPQGRTTSNTRLRRRTADFCQRDAEAL